MLNRCSGSVNQCLLPGAGPSEPEGGITQILVDQLISRAVTNLVQKRIWSPDIWSPTIGPQLIGPSGQTVPNQFSPHGQMVPKQFGPPGQMVPRIFCLSRGTGCDDLEIWGPNWLGTICPGGPNFWGPFVHGDQI